MEQQNYHVQRPWSATVVQASHSPIPLDAGTRIVQVFNRPEFKRQLLILGEPGAGKTTMMLELATDLYIQAVKKKDEPIPVLLSLSSWKNPQQSIFDWLVKELKSKYGINQKLAQQWLEKNQLLPLLDGLDEVAPQHQQDCAKALNAWLIGELEQQPCGVLICCRREEYQQVVQQPLKLYGAIYLQPLTPEQIQDYFAQFGLQDVWGTVQQDEALKKLLTTPLFLSIFGLVQTQGKFSLDKWQSSADKIEYLLDTYWEATITRELIIDPHEKQQGIRSKTYGKKSLPEQKVVQRALVFVAKALEKESQTELLIERMQPSWLPEENQRDSYRLVVMVLFVSIFAVASFCARRVSEWLVILVSTFPCLKYLLTIDRIHPTETIQFNKNIFFQKKISYSTVIVFGLFFRVTTWIIAGIAWLVARVNENVSYFFILLIAGITLNLYVALLIEHFRAEIDIPTTANQGIKNSWKNILVFTLILLYLSSTLGLLYLWRIHLFAHIKFPNQLFLAFIIYIMGLAFLEGGGKALLQHFALRLILLWNGYAPFRYDLLLNYCTERLLMQRVGGRYRFIHKLLQDHFAKMDLR